MIPKTNDELFVKEFKEMMVARQTSNNLTTTAYMQYLKYPSNLATIEGLPDLEYVLIKGIPLDNGLGQFAQLNNKLGQIINASTVTQRQRLKDNSVAKNSKGEFITKEIEVPKNSLAIVMPTKIGASQGENVKPNKDLRLVEVIVKKGIKYYIYFIPKVFIYKVNLCSLIVTPNKQRKFYKGIEVALTTGSYMYLFVVPFKEGKEETRQVISTKPSYNFDTELNAILKMWMEHNIMFNINDTSLEQGVEDTFRIGDRKRVLYNIGMLELEPTLLADEYSLSFENSIAKTEYLRYNNTEGDNEEDVSQK